MTNAHACNYIVGEGAGVLSTDGQPNVVQAQYNPNLGQWQLVDYWHDPEADTYVPQSDDIVITDANGNIDIIYINTTNGVNNVDGGKNLSPLAQPANDETDDKTSKPRERGEADLSCWNNPPADGITDRILVIGQSFHNFSWFSYIAFGRGGPSGGGGPGGGSLPPGSTAQNPLSTPGEAADCPGQTDMNQVRATPQIRAAVTALGCAQQHHRNKYFRVNFSGGKTGVYRGYGDCRSTINNVEVEAPNC